MLVFSFTKSVAKSKNDALENSQHILADAMKANNIRMRVAAENMANNKTVDYVPKAVEMREKRDRRYKINTVKVHDITRDKNKMSKIYNPSHPKADADGMVNMPKVDPLLTMMDMQRAKLDNERAMKSYQMTTDMRHRTIKMIN